MSRRSGSKLNPESYLVEEKLRDGRTFTIRALHAEDRKMWLDVFEHLSPVSVYQRFFSPKKTMTEKEVAYFTNLDFVEHVALLGIVHEKEGDVAVAVGRYHVLPPVEDVLAAEVAFAVDDPYQGLGIGTLLLKHLAIIGKRAGIREFKAFVLADNNKMLEVFENCGMPMSKALKDFYMWEISLALDS